MWASQHAVECGMPLTAQIATWNKRTQAEGPGQRFAVWFQGCPLRCPGCCNPEFLPFHGGQTVLLDDLLAEIHKTRDATGLDGITLLGGEPFAHLDAALTLAIAAREYDLGVMIFTGYTLARLRTMIDPRILALLSHTDILVDGPYDRTQPDTTRRWIGSRNQARHFLSERHHPEEPCWRQPNTLEIRVSGSDVFINGFPAIEAKPLWKGWRRKASAS